MYLLEAPPLESRSIYEGLFIIEGYSERYYFYQHGWLHNLRMRPSPA
jgi:hypothetical protein